jgi:hypothetical protein
MQCKNCVHKHINAKLIPIETIPGIEEIEDGGMGD